MTSKEKQRELRKIKQTRGWVDCLCFMKDKEYHSKEDFYKELERVYEHIDCRVLL